MRMKWSRVRESPFLFQFIAAYYDHSRVGISRGAAAAAASRMRSATAARLVGRLCALSQVSLQLTGRVLRPPLLPHRDAAWHGSWVVRGRARRAIHLVLPPPPRDGLNVWNLNG